MLSDEEKREILQDGGSQSRREAFGKVREIGLKDPMSLDEYVSFLNNFQSIFSPFEAPKKEIITKHNQL